MLQNKIFGKESKQNNIQNEKNNEIIAYDSNNYINNANKV